MPLMTINDAHRIVYEAFLRSRVSPENAKLVTDALIAAESAGQVGHGFRRVISYTAQSTSGKVDGFAVPIVERVAAATLKVDALFGFAYPALELVQSELPAMARECGIALAGVTNSHHCGVAGVVVDRLARQGLVALMFANTPAAMAPWGGNVALFGTNPIAFAAPCGDSPPIVVDVSLSKVARGKVMAAKQNDEPIPQGWALGPDGGATTDAETALNGTMVPMGDAKGTALALMVEIMAAGLTGSNFASQASSFLSADGPPPAVGQSIIAIDPTKFGGVAITDHIAGLAKSIEAQDGARVPGARRAEIALEIAANGLFVDDTLLAQIEGIGQ